MNRNHDLVLPHNCTALSGEELREVNGGGLLSFINYLLSGFNISFGSRNSHDNVDTVSTGSYAATQTVDRNGNTTTVTGGYASHNNTDTLRSGQYFNWGANFNLGGMFRAILSLFS